MRVLISPASKQGGTAEIGRAIAAALRARGIDVDVSQPEHLHRLEPYDAFIIGSALYMGKWLSEASDFVDEFDEVIRTKPTWLFSSGPLGDAAPKEPIHPDIADRLETQTQAIEHQIFGGRLDMEQLSRSDRFIARWVGAKDSDHRDWAAIEAWANAIADALLGTEARTA